MVSISRLGVSLLTIRRCRIGKEVEKIASSPLYYRSRSVSTRGGDNVTTRLTHATIVVSDYDQALSWYTEALGLELRSGDTFGEGYRFVTVGVEG